MTSEPIADWPTVCAERALLRANGRRVVFANGCFDLLHAGHVRLLEQARAAGDFLVVGLNSDRSVREIKGAGRPLLSADERAAVLGALEAVDRVVVFEEKTPQALIEALLPDVLVKGADWPMEAIVGREVVEAAGGRVARIDLLQDRSTTDLLARIRRP
jgi:D-beta-D-heptose 7-phosphate kinase/D-beta-D-heptose 1-phosphate adenosyltransferase